MLHTLSFAHFPSFLTPDYLPDDIHRRLRRFVIYGDGGYPIALLLVFMFLITSGSRIELHRGDTQAGSVETLYSMYLHNHR